jgi:hypothetical protein
MDAAAENDAAADVDAGYLLSALIRDQDVTDVPLVIGPDATIENIRIVMTQPARVSGTMLDAAGRPSSRGAVIVASTASRDWTEATSRIRLAARTRPVSMTFKVCRLDRTRSLP